MGTLSLVFQEYKGEAGVIPGRGNSMFKGPGVETVNRAAWLDCRGETEMMSPFRKDYSSFSQSSQHLAQSLVYGSHVCGVKENECQVYHTDSLDFALKLMRNHERVKRGIKVVTTVGI